MKNYLTLAAATLTFAACSNNNEPANVENEPVAAQVYASINGLSRATGTEWAANDRIGISTVGDGATTYTNVPYKYNAGFASEGTTIYFQGTEEVTFSAYYPFAGTDGTAEATITATTTADNQTAANQPTIDFLFATGAKASKAAPEVKFTGENAFKHCMSMVTLTFKEGNDVTLTNNLTAYTLSGLKLNGTFTTANGTTAVTGDAADLAMTVTDVTVAEKAYTAPSVILFPQDAASISLKITIDGKTFTATLNVPEGKLQAGNNYTYPVTISKQGLSVGEATITDWNTVTGDAADATM